MKILVAVRIPEELLKEVDRLGKRSQVIRKALEMYLGSRAVEHWENLDRELEMFKAKVRGLAVKSGVRMR